MEVVAFLRRTYVIILHFVLLRYLFVETRGAGATSCNAVYLITLYVKDRDMEDTANKVALVGNLIKKR